MLGVGSILKAVLSLPAHERKRFFKLLEQEVESCDEAGFVLIPKEIWDFLEHIRVNKQKTELRTLQHIVKLATDLSRRNRKSDPEIINRNVEICQLRQHDPKLYSLTKLAKRFDLPRSSISRILKEKEKWHQLASRLAGK